MRMGLFDRLRGASEPRTYGTAADEQALARYRYMLRTAPPETVEQAHAEAFARLTPEQRRLLLEQFGAAAAPAERAAAARAGDDAGALARLATRAEVRQPGTIERVLGRVGGAGWGGLVAGSLLGSLAGTVLGTMVAQNFLADHAPAGAAYGGAPEAEAGTADDPTIAADDFTGDDAGAGDFLDV
jgi:hypothetical protein